MTTMNKEVSVAVAQCLMKALQSTFEIQASTPMKVNKMEAIKPEHIAGVDVLASIGMKSTKFSGVVALQFPSKTLLGILNRMLGENYQEITDENADASGELMNILYASARVQINQQGHDFMPAIPTVIRGKDVSIMHGGVPVIARISCECEFGPFFLEMSLKG